MSTTYKATLTRGETYYYGNLLFTKGKAIEIDEATKEYLAGNAVDSVTMGSGDDVEQAFKCKFTFEAVAEKPAEKAEGDEAAVAVRQRK